MKTTSTPTPLNTDSAIRALTLADCRPVMSLDEVAALLGKSRTWVYERIRTGNLPKLPGHGDILISRLGLLGWLAGTTPEALFRTLLSAERLGEGATDG